MVTVHLISSSWNVRDFMIVGYVYSSQFILEQKLQRPHTKNVDRKTLKNLLEVFERFSLFHIFNMWKKQKPRRFWGRFLKNSRFPEEVLERFQVVKARLCTQVLKNNSKKVVLGHYSIGISSVVLDNCEKLVEWF